MSKQHNAENFQLFEKVLAEVRAYFVLGRPEELEAAGTREMVYRYVCKKCGDVPPIMVSAALKHLRDSNAIIFDKRVWWWLRDG